ncbi:hypothetical protein C8J55DRAFT_493284 [Lentinula edodes]|uniref:Uncharacterized protein n=1 Tax=Lentinula lateritia TaxID=40482 RepID=A0A9W9DE46_9AGAR|nr:hypothetical protein C8J55DRAFT_493284 [Lentinula edodes]
MITLSQLKDEDFANIAGSKIKKTLRTNNNVDAFKFNIRRLPTVTPFHQISIFKLLIFKLQDSRTLSPRGAVTAIGLLSVHFWSAVIRRTYEMLPAENFEKCQINYGVPLCQCLEPSRPRMQLNDPITSALPAVESDAVNYQISDRAGASSVECVTTDRRHLRKRPGPKTGRHQRRKSLLPACTQGDSLDSVSSTGDYIRSTTYLSGTSSDLSDSVLCSYKLSEPSPPMEHPSLRLSTPPTQSATFSPQADSSYPTNDLINQLKSIFPSTPYECRRCSQLDIQSHDILLHEVVVPMDLNAAPTIPGHDDNYKSEWTMQGCECQKCSFDATTSHLNFYDISPEFKATTTSVPGISGIE